MMAINYWALNGTRHSSGSFYRDHHILFPQQLFEDGTVTPISKGEKTKTEKSGNLLTQPTSHEDKIQTQAMSFRA